MAEEYAVFMKLRAIRQRLDDAVRQERLSFHRLQRMQADMPWWRGWMFVPMRMEHMKIRLMFSWTRVELWFWSQMLPERLRRLL